jgi:glutathione S-transferase
MAMFLYYTEKSPFARKVRMVMQHHKLQDEIKLVFSMPTERPQELMSRNPLGKIPVLTLGDGQSLIDSPIICQYLDTIGDERKLLSRDQTKRIEILHLEALADGIMESSVAMMLESWRPKDYQ